MAEASVRRTRRALYTIGLCLILPAPSRGQVIAAGVARHAPIIDMHLHAKSADAYGATGLPLCAPMRTIPVWDQRYLMGEGPNATPTCAKPLISPATDAEVREGTIARMRRYNMYGVLGGAPELVAQWQRAAPGRFMAGLDVRFDPTTAQGFASTPAGVPARPLPPDSVRALHARGALSVLAELSNQYAGLSPDDPRLEPYFATAEQLDVPVGIHVDGGGPGAAYNGTPGYRARLQSPFTLEEVLLRHPKLRLYIMHAAFPMIEPLEAMLLAHPQVYVELGYIASVEPRAAYYRFLRRLVEDGFGERIMFGSDQMIWPGMIDEAVRALEQARFLTKAQRRAIFYDNAARFLRLTPEEIARHHGKAAASPLPRNRPKAPT